MHYFVIHSTKDSERVDALIENWGAELNNFKCSLLRSNKEDWHDDARAKIRGSDKVLYIVGEASGTSENIDWELNVSFEENKEIYVYMLDSSYPINKVLEKPKKRTFVQDGEKDGEIVFTQKKQRVFIMNDAEIAIRFKDDETYISEHIDATQRENLDIAMKQYEIFVETSEELVRRKQTVNSFYITLCSLIVSVILAAYAFKGSITIIGFQVASSTVISCLASIVGGIVCFSWTSVIQSYADLNSSKMKIISYIESQLAYNLYDTEWQLVSKRMGNRKYKSFSGKEKFIAKLFFGLYGILFVAGICLSIM